MNIIDPVADERKAAMLLQMAEARVAQEYRKHCARRFPQARILELSTSSAAAAAVALNDPARSVK